MRTTHHTNTNPPLPTITNPSTPPSPNKPHSYKIGDTFYSVPLPTAQKLLESSTTEIDEDVNKLEDQLSSMKEEMDGLKAHLYARFGRGINLEG